MAMSNNERVPKLDVKDKKIEKKEIEEKGKKKEKETNTFEKLGCGRLPWCKTVSVNIRLYFLLYSSLYGDSAQKNKE